MKHKEQSEEDGMSNLMTILLARPLSTCSAERISARDVSDGTDLSYCEVKQLGLWFAPCPFPFCRIPFHHHRLYIFRAAYKIS